MYKNVHQYVLILISVLKNKYNSHSECVTLLASVRDIIGWKEFCNLRQSKDCKAARFSYQWQISNHLTVFSKLSVISHFRVADIVYFNILVKYAYLIIYTMVSYVIFHVDSRTFRLAKLVKSNADNDISQISCPYHSSDLDIILRCTLFQNISVNIPHSL